MTTLMTALYAAWVAHRMESHPPDSLSGCFPDRCAADIQEYFDALDVVDEIVSPYTAADYEDRR